VKAIFYLSSKCRRRNGSLTSAGKYLVIVALGSGLVHVRGVESCLGTRASRFHCRSRGGDSFNRVDLYALCALPYEPTAITLVLGKAARVGACCSENLL